MGRAGFAGALVVAAMLLVVWIRTLPLSLGGVDPPARAQLTYTAADGRDHVYLGDYDSYYWLRAARRVLQSGTICDRRVNGECRDDHTHAPFGGLGKYEWSMHVASVVWVQRFMAWWQPGYPLPSSAFLVPVIVGALGVLPAFAIGRQLAGAMGGLVAALMIAVNPLFLMRSIGSDNDVWNIVLPLCLVWAAMRATQAVNVRQQVGYGVLGIVVVVVHAVTWNGWLFTYAVVLGGLLGNLIVTALRSAAHERRIWRERRTRQAAVALVCFAAAPLALACLPGADVPSLTDVWRPVSAIYSASPSTSKSEAAAQWPDAFRAVGELARPDLRNIAALLAGVAYFFIAWLGLLVLLLPRQRWHWWHFATLIAGNYLYAYLVTRPNPGRLLLLVLLALPLAVALVSSALYADRSEETEHGATLLVVGWFLCALFLAFDGLRFTMLLIAPFGIVFGVGIGRLYEWLSHHAPPLPLPRWVAHALLFGVLAGAILYAPVRGAVAVATGYVPRVNDAWWETLTRIRDQTSPETIVSTWWPYGYWAEYAADRRTSIDGGSLPTHVPYWFARMLFAPTEDEALGLLRMLDCGSDFHPIDKREAGAYDRLVWQGLDGITAQAMLLDLTQRSRPDAQEFLRTRGIVGEAQLQILAMTHCQPPPALLLLSTEMIDSPGWKELGSWSFQNAYVANHLRGRPEGEAVQQLTTHFGMSAEQGRELYRRAVRLDTEPARAVFVSPRQSYLTKAWVPCRPLPAGQELVCALNLQVTPGGDVLEDFTYRRETPSAGRVRWRHAAGAVRGDERVEVIVAGAGPIERVAPADTPLAILVDVLNDRVLVGTPALLRSTFTQLVFLDGRDARRFRKVEERTGYRGERVMTWAVDWDTDTRSADEGA